MTLEAGVLALLEDGDFRPTSHVWTPASLLPLQEVYRQVEAMLARKSRVQAAMPSLRLLPQGTKYHTLYTYLVLSSRKAELSRHSNQGEFLVALGRFYDAYGHILRLLHREFVSLPIPEPKLRRLPMRLGVIRADLPQAIFIADLEPTSQIDPATDPKGQTRYLSRPSAPTIQTYLNAQGLAASATTLIAATVPVGGPVNVSAATITGVAGLGGATGTQIVALQDFLAPRLVETRVVRESFLVGNISKFRDPAFNPDPRRVPAFTPGAAIGVVPDAGTGLFTYVLPTIVSATLGAPAPGAVTIVGGGLWYVNTPIIIKFGGSITKRLYRRNIELAGGTLSETSIVIPASLIPGAAVTSTTVFVQVGSLVSATVALVLSHPKM